MKLKVSFRIKAREQLSGSSFAILLLLIGMAFVIAKGLTYRLPSQTSDSAGFLDLVEMPFPNLLLKNSVLASHGLGLMSTFGLSAETINSFISSYEPQIVSHWPYHPYLFSIFLGGLDKLPGVDTVFISTFSIAISYVLGLSAIYLFMHRKRVPKYLIFIWLLIIILCPAVFESLRGQLYFDRIFMGPGIGLVIGTIILHEDPKDKLGRRLLFFSLPVSVLISDRTLISATLILLVFPLSLVLSKRHFSNSIPFLLRTIPYGLLTLIWYLIWAKFISKPFTSTPSIFEFLSYGNFVSAWDRLSGNQSPQFVIFLGTILFFFCLSTLNLSSIPLLVIALLPNIIIDIGGAQLIGYSTHYHQLYIPILLSLATIGLVRFERKLSNQSTMAKLSGATICALAGFTTLAFWISNPEYDGSTKTFVGKSLQAYGLQPWDKESANLLENQLSPLRAEFVRHNIQSISTLESLMPYVVLHTNYIVSYFPAGVGMSDAVLVNYESGQRLPVVYPYIEPTPGVTMEVSEYVQARLDLNYRKIIEIDRGPYKTVLYLRTEIK